MTEEDIDGIIDLMNLHDEVKKTSHDYEFKKINKKTFKNDQERRVYMKYLTVAKTFWNIFFKTYPALMKRLEREKIMIADEEIIHRSSDGKKGQNYGYMQSWKGPKRRLPEIRYMNKRRSRYDDGREYNWRVSLQGADKQEWSRYYAELGNIAANSDAQMLEVYAAFTLWHNMHTNLKKWGFKSRVFNGTHDSLDKFLYEGEEDLVLAMEKWVATRPSVPYCDMPLDIEAEISDVSSHEARQKTWYKGGKSYEPTNFIHELQEWNKAHTDNQLVWYNTLPTDYDTSEMPEDLMVIDRKGYTVQ
jgi:hypothetical protein